MAAGAVDREFADLFLENCQNLSQTDTKRSQNDPNMVPKLCQNNPNKYPKMIP